MIVKLLLMLLNNQKEYFKKLILKKQNNNQNNLVGLYNIFTQIRNKIGIQLKKQKKLIHKIKINELL